jgi:hypothetical protein
MGVPLRHSQVWPPILCAHRAQGKVALRLVGGGGDGHGVQIGVVGGPQMGAGHLQPERLPAPARGGEHPPVPQGDGQAEAFTPGVHLHRHPGQVRGEPHRPNGPLGGDRLQPHRLPDAGRRGVPHPMGPPVLLAVGVGVGQGVHRLHLQKVFPGAQGAGDICGEGQVAPLVADHAHPVDKGLRHLVHRAEVEQRPVTLGEEPLREGEGVLIPEHVLHRPAIAGQGGLGRPGDPDRPPVQGPAPVQREKAVPPELGAGVFAAPITFLHA